MNNARQTQKQKENQNENKKAGKPFLIVMAISVVIGGVFGFFSLEIADFLKNNNLTMETASICSIRIFAAAAPYAMWILGIAALIYTMFALKKGRKEFEEYGTENESVMEKIEKRLSVGLFLTRSLLLVNYFLFAAHIIAVVKDIYPKGFMFLFSILGLVMSMAVSIIQQQKMVDFVKEMNPEKKGSIIFETGPLPIAIVIGILFYSQLVYSVEAAKGEWNRK